MPPDASGYDYRVGLTFAYVVASQVRREPTIHCRPRLHLIEPYTSDLYYFPFSSSTRLVQTFELSGNNGGDRMAVRYPFPSQLHATAQPRNFSNQATANILRRLRR